MCVKEYGHLSELKSLISVTELILKWPWASEDSFQTEFIEFSLLHNDAGVGPQWEQEKGLLIEN